jgi:hypothetical protein
MTTAELRDFVRQKIPVFKDVIALGRGTGFHYTPHRTAIKAFGRFLGGPVSPHVHQTQKSEISELATDPNGVVFAYPTLTAAVWEGLGKDIYLIRYTSAVSAIQSADQGAAGKQTAKDPNLMILANEIVGFEYLGPARQFWIKLAPDGVPTNTRIKTGIVVQNASDLDIALQEAAKLQAYVAMLSLGQVALEASIRSVTEVRRDMAARPFAALILGETTTMLLTQETLWNGPCEVAGWGDGENRQAVISVPELEAYQRKFGPNRSVDTVVHEWLHSLHGLPVCAIPIPNPDHDRSFLYPGAYSDDRRAGELTGWKNWYHAVLNGVQRPTR